jgi:hypothetical protein
MSEKKGVKVTLAEATGPAPKPPFPVPTRWRIEVRSDSGIEFNFKAAIAHDGQLELIESSTPLDRAFTASRYIGLFEGPKGCKLRVTAFVEIGGRYLPQASSAGDRGCKLIFDQGFQAYGAGSL